MNSDELIFNSYIECKTYKNIANNVTKYFKDDLLSSFDALVILEDVFVTNHSFKECLPQLKVVLSTAGVLKFRQQYRQFKYKQKQQYQNISIRKETYINIKALAVDFDGIDDLFAFAFDKDYEIDKTKLNKLPDSITKREKLSVLLDSVDDDIYSIILSALDQAFKDGFILGQKTKKIRSKVKLTEALHLLEYNCNITNCS